MGVFAAAIVFSVYKLQFIEGNHWRKESAKFSVKSEKVKAIRGNIFDCNGALLSTSLPIYDLAIDATAPAFSVKDTFDKYIDSLALLFYNEFPLPKVGVSYYHTLFTNMRSKGLGYNLIKLNVSHQQLLRIQKFPLFKMGKISGGLFIIPKTKRIKPFQNLALRTIGFANSSSSDLVGLEGFFNDYLKGKDGLQMMQRVTGGVYVPINNEEKNEAENGCDIISTIDINLQDVAQQSLLKVLQSNMAMRGTVILMEVATGEIKAIANLTRKGEGTYEERLNDAIRTKMQPGSTFKLVTMMSLLDNGFITPKSIVNVEGGSAIVYGRKVEDSHNYNELNMQQAFEMSSNVAFAKQIAKYYDLNPSKHYDFLDGLGLNKILKLQLLGAQAPQYLKPSSRYWSKSDLSAISRGYGISLTPLQVLTIYNAIANNGKMVNPFFVKKIMSAGQIVKEYKTQVLKEQICSQATVAQLKNMMEGVVKNGTAYNKENGNLPYTFAGKTGTAIIQRGEDYYQGGAKVYRASWCGYFPSEKPKYSCYVVIIRPQGSMIYGAQLALPVFKDLANKIYATSTNIHKDVRETYTGFSNDLPQVAKAYKDDVKIILDNVGISSHLNDSVSDLESNWFSVSQQHNALILLPIVNKPKQMPDVKGMSARDATYLLESKGLRVSIAGFGKVKQQSIKAGANYSKGLKVNLILG
jgi:cell division protein FtsI (penicillin-binding protein 3)